MQGPHMGLLLGTMQDSTESQPGQPLHARHYDPMTESVKQVRE